MENTEQPRVEILSEEIVESRKLDAIPDLTNLEELEGYFRRAALAQRGYESAMTVLKAIILQEGGSLWLERHYLNEAANYDIEVTDMLPQHSNVRLWSVPKKR